MDLSGSANFRPKGCHLTLKAMLSAFAVFLPVLGASPLGVGAQGATEVLEAASERYASLDGFCADFKQMVEVTLLRQTTRSRGELCQLPPDRFEMRFTDPEGDRVVADGEDLWVYFPSTDEGQVFRHHLGATDGRFDLHGEFLSNPGERYRATHEGRESVNGTDTHVLLLEPVESARYQKARVWIDTANHLIRKLEIHDDADSIRIIELSNLRLNPVISSDRFHFDPPSGVQVISR